MKKVILPLVLYSVTCLAQHPIATVGGTPVPPATAVKGNPVPPATIVRGNPVPPTTIVRSNPVPPATIVRGNPVPPATIVRGNPVPPTTIVRGNPVPPATIVRGNPVPPTTAVQSAVQEEEQRLRLDEQQQMWNQRFQELSTTLSSINTRYDALCESIENLARENQELREEHAKLLALLTDHINTSDARTKTPVGTPISADLVSPGVSPIKPPVAGKRKSSDIRKSVPCTAEVAKQTLDDVPQEQKWISDEACEVIKNTKTLAPGSLNKIFDAIPVLLEADKSQINYVANLLFQYNVKSGRTKAQLTPIKDALRARARAISATKAANIAIAEEDLLGVKSGRKPRRGGTRKKR